MRYRLILPIAALVAALLAVPAAQAKARVGLSEQNPAVFDSANWKPLKLKRVRYIVPWDYAKTAAEHAEVDGVHEPPRTPTSRTCSSSSTRIAAASSNNKYKKTKACKAPSISAYKKAVKALPQGVPVREDVRAVERGQPRLAADVQEPEAGGQVLQGHEELVQEVHDPGGRPARPAQHRQLPAQVPEGVEAQGPDLGPAQLQRRQPPPEQGHPARPGRHQGPALADRDGRPRAVQDVGLQVLAEARRQGDEVPVQARQEVQADQAGLRLPLVRRAEAPRASTPASSAPTARRARG